MRRFLSTYVCLLLLLFAPPLRAQTENPAEFSAFVKQFTDCYSKRDVKGFMTLWHPLSPEYALREQGMQSLFQREQCEFKSVTILSVGRGQGNLSDGRACSFVLLRLVCAGAIHTFAPGPVYYEPNGALHTPSVEGTAKAIQFDRYLTLCFDKTWKVWSYASASDYLIDILRSPMPPESKRVILSNEAQIADATGAHQMRAIGEQLVNNGDFTTAKVVYDAAKTLSGTRLHTTECVVTVQNDLGDLAWQQGRESDALKIYRDAYLYAKIHKDSYTMAQALHHQGELRYARGEIKNAQKDFLTVRDLLKPLTAKQAPYRKDWLALTQAMLGETLARERPAEAKACFLQAENQYEALVGHKPSTEWLLIDLLTRAADASLSQDDYRAAERLYQKALERYEQINSSVEIGRCYLALGQIASAQHQYRKALSQLHSAQSYLIAAPEKAYILMALVHVYNGLGRVREAYQAGVTAFHLFKAAHNWQGGFLSWLAIQNSVTASQKVSEQETAWLLDAPAMQIGSAGAKLPGYYRPSGSQLTLPVPPKNAFVGFGSLERCINTALLIESKFDCPLPRRAVTPRGLTILAHIFAWAQREERTAWISAIALDLSQEYEILGDRNKSVGYARRALDAAKKTESPELIWRAFAQCGKLYGAQGKIVHALLCYRSALSAIEFECDYTVGAEDQYRWYLDEKARLYQRVVVLSYQQRNTLTALQYAERIKGRALLDTMLQARVPLASRLNADTSAALLRMSQADAAAQKAYQQRLKSISGPLAGASSTGVSRRVLQSLLSDNKTALLEYAVTDSGVFLFVASRAKGERGFSLTLTMQKLYEDAQNKFPLSEAALNRAIDFLRDKIQLRGQDSRTLLPDCDGFVYRSDYDNRSRSLYNILLPANIRARLAGKSLIIAPDGKLWQLPFWALRTDKATGGAVRQRFLIQDHALSFTYSFTWLYRVRKLHKQRDRPPLAFIGFSNTPEKLMATNRRKKQSPNPTLANAGGQEARPVAAICRLYSSSGLRTSTCVGKNNSRQHFFDTAWKARVLHFAVHGHLDDKNPLASSLRLYNDAKLTGRDIMRTRLNADIAVLAACNAANGFVGQGEGLIALSWAFALVGCETTVGGQWDVPILGADHLTARLHRELRDIFAGSSHKTRAEAMQAAVKYMLSTKEWSDPRWWAGFALIGDGGSIAPTQGRRAQAPKPIPEPKVFQGKPCVKVALEAQLAGGSKHFGTSVIDAKPGDAITLKMFITNTGTAPAHNVKITLPLGYGSGYITDTSCIRIKLGNQNIDKILPKRQVKANNQQITWNLGSINPTPESSLYLICQVRLADEKRLSALARRFKYDTKTNDADVIGIAPLPFYASFSADYAKGFFLSEMTNDVILAVETTREPYSQFQIRAETKNLSLKSSCWSDQGDTIASSGDAIAIRFTILNTGNVAAKIRFYTSTLENVQFSNECDIKTLAVHKTVSATALTGEGVPLGLIQPGTAHYVEVTLTGKVKSAPAGGLAIQPITGFLSAAPDHPVKTAYRNSDGKQFLGVLKDEKGKTWDAAVTGQFYCSNMRGVYVVQQVLDERTRQYVFSLPKALVSGDEITYRTLVMNNTVRTVNTIECELNLPPCLEYIEGTMAFGGTLMPQFSPLNFYRMSLMGPGFCEEVTFKARVSDITLLDCSAPYVRLKADTKFLLWGRPNVHFVLR